MKRGAALFLFYLLAVASFALPGEASAQFISTERVSAAEFGRLWGPALAGTNATQVLNFPTGPSYPVTTTPVTTAEAGGGLAVSKTAKIPLGNAGPVIDVVAKSPISKAAMGKAFKAAAALSGGPLGLGFFALSEILDWMTSAKVRRNVANDGFEVQDPAVCTVSPCYEYSTSVAGSSFSPYYSVKLTACQWAASSNQANTGYAYIAQNPRITFIYGADHCTVDLYQRSNGTFNSTQYYGFNSRSASPQPVSWLPASMDDIVPYMQSPTMKTGWLDKLLQTGVQVDAGTAQASGPSSVQGPVKTSQKVNKDAAGNPTGTTTTTQTPTYNITYNTNTVSYTTTIVTTVTNPDGTKEETTEQKQDVIEPQPTDTPMPELPKLYERKYPNGLQGVWDQKKAQLQSSPLMNLLSGLMPSVGSSGTCPTMMISLDVGIANYGEHDFAPPCWVWDFGRVVVIASALLLARALIFGG